jgi:hypothetical protein
MIAPDDGCKESKGLCDSLFSQLSEKISGLQIIRTLGSCGFFQKGKSRFAYIYHNRKIAQK